MGSCYCYFRVKRIEKIKPLVNNGISYTEIELILTVSSWLPSIPRVWSIYYFHFIRLQITLLQKLHERYMLIKHQVIFLNFFLLHLFIFERAQVGEEQRENETESEAGSRLWTVSTEPLVGLELTNREIMTWAKVGPSTHWATQAPPGFSFKRLSSAVSFTP